MNVKDLVYLRDNVQELVNNYLKKTGKTQSKLAVEAGIHPAQLLLFMRSERGLTDSSLMKLGRVINETK